MAPENRVTRQNVISQQEDQNSKVSFEQGLIDKKATPLSHEEIAFMDTLLAKYLLINELLQIYEFAELWEQAKRNIPGEVIKEIKSGLEDIFTDLSPEARGALSIGEKAYALYDENALNEAEAAAIRFKLLCDSLNAKMQNGDMQPKYSHDLEALVQPLGVPGLVDMMMFLDMKEWGIAQIFTGPIAGATRELLESKLLQDLIGLTPIQAISETRTSIRKRVRRNVSPLSRHFKRYALHQRIQLWVRNVVHGEPIRNIAFGLRDEVNRIEDEGYDRDSWIKKQIKDASRVLGFKRLSGRPRKGGVLRQWKLMVK